MLVDGVGLAGLGKAMEVIEIQINSLSLACQGRAATTARSGLSLGHPDRWTSDV